MTYDPLELSVGIGATDRVELDAFGGLSRQGVEARVAILEEGRGDLFSLAAGVAVGGAFRWNPAPGFAPGRAPHDLAPFGRAALDASIRPVPWFLVVANYAASAGPWAAGDNVYVREDQIRVLAGVGVGLATVPNADGSGVRFILGCSVESRLVSLGNRELGIYYANPSAVAVSAVDGLAYTVTLGVEGTTGRLF